MNELQPARLELVKAEIDQQVSTAKAYPRDVSQCIQELKDIVTIDLSTAESCVYSLPRDGKAISGASVRFAEMAVQAWGNVRAGWRVVEISDKWVECEGICHDMQKNNIGTATAKRSIYGRKGRYSDNMIQTTIMACGAIAYRNAVFKIIPASLTAPALEVAHQKIIKEAGDYKPRLDAMAKEFETLGVDKSALCKYFAIEKVSDMTAHMFVVCRGIYNSLKSGEAEPYDYFGGKKRKGPSEGVSIDDLGKGE